MGEAIFRRREEVKFRERNFGRNREKCEVKRKCRFEKGNLSRGGKKKWKKWISFFNYLFHFLFGNYVINIYMNTTFEL